MAGISWEKYVNNMAADDLHFLHHQVMNIHDTKHVL